MTIELNPDYVSMAKRLLGLIEAFSALAVTTGQG